MLGRKNNQNIIPESDIPSPNEFPPSQTIQNEQPVQDYPSFSEAEDEINQSALNQEAQYTEPEPSEFNPSILEQNNTQQPPEPQNKKFKEYPPSQLPQSQPVALEFGTNLDDIEELIESVVEDKWRSFIENFGDIALWKDKMKTEVISIKQELVRLEDRFENLQRAVLGRIQTYDKNILEVGTEIKALEKVFQNIIQPLSSNIKELSRLTEKLKK
ncbi:hypothetical protein HYV88_04640 [Candidatus Woesearchaeota archaeon]|nr:hypothetical protein [Candidatus Woesearchaeota archaeon]